MNDSTEQKSGYGRRPLWQWIALYGITAVIVYGAVYYLIAGNKGGYGNTSNAQPVQTTADAAGTQQFTVTGTEFSFEPAIITVNKGSPVSITFKNKGKYPHNMAITDLNAQSKTIQPGQQDTFTFTPTTSGQYSFICTVPGHADKGMTGTLNVQ